MSQSNNQDAMTLLEIEEQCLKDSERWFGETGVAHDLEYLALCIAGEVGEFCNLLKKIRRGTLEHNENTHLELAMELTDVFIYVCNAAAVMNVNLEEAYKYKRGYNESRFGSATDPTNNGAAE